MDLNGSQIAQNPQIVTYLLIWKATGYQTGIQTASKMVAILHAHYLSTIAVKAQY